MDVERTATTIITAYQCVLRKLYRCKCLFWTIPSRNVCEREREQECDRPGHNQPAEQKRHQKSICLLVFRLSFVIVVYDFSWCHLQCSLLNKKCVAWNRKKCAYASDSTRQANVLFDFQRRWGEREREKKKSVTTLYTRAHPKRAFDTFRKMHY